jgi:hypothetical protein
MLAHDRLPLSNDGRILISEVYRLTKLFSFLLIEYRKHPMFCQELNGSVLKIEQQTTHDADSDIGTG